MASDGTPARRMAMDGQSDPGQVESALASFAAFPASAVFAAQIRDQEQNGQGQQGQVGKEG